MGENIKEQLSCWCQVNCNFQGAVRGVCVACVGFESGASPALALIRACKCCYYHQEQSGSLKQRQNGAGAALLLLLQQRQGRQNS